MGGAQKFWLEPAVLGDDLAFVGSLLFGAQS